MPNTPTAPRMIGRQDRYQYAKCSAVTPRTGSATKRDATVSGHRIRNSRISSQYGRGAVLMKLSMGCSGPAESTVIMRRATARTMAILSDASPHAISLTLGQAAPDLEALPGHPNGIRGASGKDLSLWKVLGRPALYGGFGPIRVVRIMCSVLSHELWAGLRHGRALGMGSPLGLG